MLQHLVSSLFTTITRYQVLLVLVVPGTIPVPGRLQVVVLVDTTEQ